ncbi:cobyrinic acid a,c-diamide synthase [Labilibaculum manganireducens]|uniref:Cobyrinate a,c-diamide synthase n=1 Tax=Labilibaculum manganireducens TaxID=1940525 RepID=A0A2N3HTU7_9BACT|nr:cobyrinate a,c-diamide synthase [Labilibaculum manganireducens]PKQ61473.1 cobyrinic acid a,c-diamide synthase [Labilibaculum manganireducens]
MKKKPQFLIAAPSSGSGKTTITQGILRYLKNKGLQVQPFKCGPDYLDTKHHSWAAGNVSINLDTFMSSKSHVKNIYGKYSIQADVSVVEGVMGLFDGAKKMEGSSAQIAELLDIPIILVVNAKATAYSVAPLLFGFKNFYPGVKIAGVIFNFVSSESHYQFLKDACEDVGVTPLGYVPKNEKLHLPSRYLGLQITDSSQYNSTIEEIAIHISKTVDIEKLLELTKIPFQEPEVDETIERGNLKISVAKDEAFNFTYHENLAALEKLGEITFFSPLRDQHLPATDLLYFAGGYPELYLDELSSNESMKKAVKEFCLKGGRVLAECGGMMYLGDSIIDSDSNKFPMVGYLDQKTSMENMKLKLGYRKIHVNGNIFFGHEFHYSHIINPSMKFLVGEIYSARDQKLDTFLFRKNNTIASYIHFYWGEKNIMDLLF